MATKYRVYKSDAWGNYGAQFPTIREGFTNLREAQEKNYNELWFVANEIVTHPDPGMEGWGYYKLVSSKRSGLFHLLITKPGGKIGISHVIPLLPGEPENTVRHNSAIRVSESDMNDIIKRISDYSKTEQGTIERRTKRQIRKRQELLDRVKANNLNLWNLQALLRRSNVTNVNPADFATFDDFYEALERATELNPIQGSNVQPVSHFAPLPAELTDEPVFLPKPVNNPIPSPSAYLGQVIDLEESIEF